MKYVDREITTIGELLDLLTTDRAQNGVAPIWYRGQTHSG